MGFRYDANGRMVKATKANVPDALSVYDAAGMRVAERVNDVWRFSIYDIGGKIVAEYGGVPATDEGGVKYLLSDWQGSNRAVLSNTGNVRARVDYTAYGENIGAGTGLRTNAQGFDAAINPRQQYGLTERDSATGLDHTWFRKNEGRAGRWTSPDPYNGSMSRGNPQTLNRYSYVVGQPTNYVDPKGLNVVTVCQWWGWFIYPDGFDHPETKKQAGNSWLVCTTTYSFGGTEVRSDFPGEGGVVGVDINNPDSAARQFESCVTKTIQRIQEDLKTTLDKIDRDETRDIGVGIAMLGLTIVGTVIFTAITGGAGALVGIGFLVSVGGEVALATTAWGISVSNANEKRADARADAKTKSNRAWEDCAESSGVQLGAAHPH